MGAPDILTHLAERGIRLQPLPDGNLKASPAGVLTDAERAEIRAHKPALVDLLQRQPAPDPSPPAQARPATIPPTVRALLGLDDAEIERMAGRIRQALAAGYSRDDAEQIADRLLLRDRTGLDMHVCLECARLSGRRCLAARTLGAAPDLQPIRHELQRCPAFRIGRPSGC